MSVLINDIFWTLTSFEVEQLMKYSSLSKFKEIRNEHKFEDFRDRLREHKMDDYTEPLYNYMIIATKRNLDYKRQEPVSLSNRKDQLTYQEDLVNLLKILLSKNSIKAITIKCRKSIKQQPIQVNSDDIKIIADSAVDPIWGKIEQMGLNWFPITREEAVEEINSHIDVEWTKSWMETMGYVDPNYASFTLDKFEDYWGALGWGQVIHNSHKQLREEFITEYIYDHQIELPLNLETIGRISDLIKEEKSKRGRKEDTFILKSTAYQLSVLKHAEQYLKNKTVASILDIPISDDDHYFIHDVLVFFDLLDTYRDKPDNEKILKKRIRKIILDYIDPAGIRDIDEKFQLLRHQTSDPE